MLNELRSWEIIQFWIILLFTLDRSFYFVAILFFGKLNAISWLWEHNWEFVIQGLRDDQNVSSLQTPNANILVMKVF